jgi:hypothetical protein
MHATQPRTGQLRADHLGGTSLEITRVGLGAWAIEGGSWQFEAGTNRGRR